MSVNFSVASAMEKSELDINDLPAMSNVASVESTKRELLDVPDCENADFYKKTLNRIREYSASIINTSAIGKRKKALLLANIDGFERFDIADLTPQISRNTANAIITLKVNKHLKDKDFIICKQTGENKNPLYLIMYPQTENYMVHIINLDPYSNDYNKISFSYP